MLFSRGGRKLRRRGKVVISVVAQSLFIAAAAYAQLVTYSAEPSARIAVLAPVPFSLYFMWRLFQNPFVILAERGVYVNNTYSEWFIPYYEIEGCGMGLGLVINTRRSGKVFATAFDPSLSSKSVRREIEREIMTRVEKSRVDLNVKMEKRYTMGTPEVIGPMFTFALFVVAVSLQ